MEAPWHQILNEDDEEPAPVSGAATKRLPIRGLQHFIASSAWFCKLCNKWIGDLHCASAHLKSKGHAKSYMVNIFQKTVKIYCWKIIIIK